MTSDLREPIKLTKRLKLIKPFQVQVQVQASSSSSKPFSESLKNNTAMHQ